MCILTFIKINKLNVDLDAFTKLFSETHQKPHVFSCHHPLSCICPSATGLSGDMSSAAECRPALRGLALSRAEDLRAELLRAEHLKAEAMWEENSDSSRQAKITSTKNKSIRRANAPQH